MKKVLSIDGGGIFGISPTNILQYIYFQKSIKYYNWDMVVGNSTGAILGSMLSTGYSPQEILDLYKDNGKDIFKTSLWRKIKTLWGLAEPKYDRSFLDNIMREMLEDKKLQNDFMCYSYDLSSGYPLFYKSWSEKNVKTRLVDMVLGSVSAPTYFKPYYITNIFDHVTDRTLLIDGGMAANNPAMCAYAEAKKRWPDEKILLLSLGTISTNRFFNRSDLVRFNIIDYAKNIPAFMLDASEDTVDYQCRQMVEAMDDIYIRLSGYSMNDMKMDDASKANINKILRISNTVIDTNHDKIDNLVNNLL